MSCMQVVSCCRAVSVPRGAFPGRRTPETSAVLSVSFGGTNKKSDLLLIVDSSTRCLKHLPHLVYEPEKWGQHRGTAAEPPPATPASQRGLRTEVHNSEELGK